MKLIGKIKKSGICVLRCFSYDGHVDIPERMHGLRVEELGAYAFANVVRGLDRKGAGPSGAGQEEAGDYFIWQDDGGDDKEERAERKEEGKDGEEQGEAGSEGWKVCSEEVCREILFLDALKDGTPAVRGSALYAISLPEGLTKIGAYAFYQCENLEKIAFFSRISDLGAGLFTGCHGVRELDVQNVPGEKSCLKEVLAELKQTLRVNLRDEKGRSKARLIFPEYFEESIENTPARILTQEMHGCGHRYRNAFSGTELQFSVYDKLFLHLQVQEGTGMATELALGRLCFPLQLSDERKAAYETYVAEHGREVVRLALLQQEETEEILRFVGQAAWCSRECLEEMLDEAGQRKHPQAAGILMEFYRRKGREREGGRKSWLIL